MTTIIISFLMHSLPTGEYKPFAPATILREPVEYPILDAEGNNLIRGQHYMYYGRPVEFLLADYASNGIIDRAARLHYRTERGIEFDFLFAQRTNGVRSTQYKSALKPIRLL